MSERSDRLLLLVVAATALVALIGGYAGGLAEAEIGGWLETLAMGAFAGLVVLILAGLWIEFGRTNQPNQ